MIADDFRAISGATRKDVAPVVRPVPTGYATWVRETSDGNLDLEIGRLKRGGVV